jgi:hypothetical protein
MQTAIVLSERCPECLTLLVPSFPNSFQPEVFVNSIIFQRRRASLGKALRPEDVDTSLTKVTLLQSKGENELGRR